MMKNNLRLLRERKGITQETVANLLGVTQQSVSNYEAGIDNPSLESLILLRDFYGTNLEYLLALSSVTDPLSNYKQGSSDEVSVMESMRNMTDENRRVFVKTAKTIGDKDKAEKEARIIAENEKRKAFKKQQK